MALENMTITLPRPLLKRLRVLAAQLNTSVSKLLAQQAEQLLARTSSRERALREETARMKNGLYEVGPVTWTRDDLHARK